MSKNSNHRLRFLITVINQKRGINIETRKVQQTGGSTYIISLPKQWAEKMGIKTGVRVSLQAQPDGKLLIDPILEEAGFTK